MPVVALADQIRDAHAKWQTATHLVVRTAREVCDGISTLKELRGALSAEQKARVEFETLLREEQAEEQRERDRADAERERAERELRAKAHRDDPRKS